MTSSTRHELMDPWSIFALISPTLVTWAYSSLSLPAVDDMSRGEGKPEVADGPGEIVRYEEGAPTFFSMMRSRILGGPDKHTNPNHRPEAGFDYSFSGLRSPSSSSLDSQSTGSTIPYQELPNTKPHANLSIEVSNPRSRGDTPPLKQLLDFCWSLFQSNSYAYLSFLRAYPEYELTLPIDTLRKHEYKRLELSGEVYMDYMGASLYPESLIRHNSTFLCETILGNTHSISTSSHQSATCAEEARSSVLAFFDAPATEYTVIFTPNATGAMRLVGEAFPFVQDSSFVLGEDSHNSINGIRQFALAKGAVTAYIASTPLGGMEESEAKSVLMAHRPRSPLADSPCLFALTGSSNVTNSKNPLSLVKYASDLGYYTLLDAAALAPSSKISLRTIGADAMAISFYKMFGFPTGVGCLVAKKSFLRQLKRPWFAGGTVDVVQVPGDGFTAAQEIHEQFEDGTINFASLAAVTRGLNMLSRYAPYLPLRLSSLTHYLAESLTEIKHDAARTPVAHILSRTPGRRLSAVGEQSDTGSTVSLNFLEPSGEVMSNSFVEYAATQHKISIRTGCMCNPGGATAILGAQEEMEKYSPGISRGDFGNLVGKELGVVRLSLGLASDFSDVHRLLCFVRGVIACDSERKKIWSKWELRGQRHA